MLKKAYFAGGCFWGLEDMFKKLAGVIDTDAGYTGGDNEDPTYENHPGHAEALEITYNSDQISLEYHQDYLEKNPGGYTCHVAYFDSYLK